MVSMSGTGIKTSSKVYRPLIDQIHRSIGSGALRPGQLIGSEYELARQASISRMSVRRAMDQLVAEGLVERRPGKGVYVRDTVTSTRLVQVVVPSMSFDQCVQIAQGAQALGMDRGVQLQVYDAHARMDWDIQVIRQLPKSAVQGAIIASWHHPRFAEVLYELKRVDYPFVLVDERLHDIDVPSVLVDNHGGGYRVGQELIAAGHRRIGFIGNFAADTVRARLEGLRDAVNDAKVPFDRSLAIDLKMDDPDGDWPAAIARATIELMRRPDAPTAIFYSDDQTAAHGFKALKSLGLRIPEDVSVVGFDDNPLCQWLDPTLSTVRQPSREMGQVALEMLLQRMIDPRRPAEHRVLPTQWVGRESIAPPKAGAR